jgi:aminoglycoside phosphotransferase family enzyme
MNMRLTHIQFLGLGDHADPTREKRKKMIKYVAGIVLGCLVLCSLAMVKAAVASTDGEDASAVHRSMSSAAAAAHQAYEQTRTFVQKPKVEVAPEQAAAALPKPKVGAKKGKR